MFLSFVRVLTMKRDNEFLKKLLKLTMPMALQQLFMSTLFIFDTVFVGGLGDAYLSAVGQAGNITMLMWCGYYAISSAGSIYAAQYWGKNQDITGVRKAFTASIAFGSFVAVVFFVLAFFLNKYIMLILSQDQQVRDIACTYLAIVAFTYPIWAVSSMYAAILKSIGITKIPLYASIIGFGVNIALDSVLVNGYLGFPKWGVRAAAGTTILGAAIELILLIVLSRRANCPLTMRRHDFIKPEKDLFRQFFRAALPLAAKDQLWAAGVTVYSIAFTTLGVAATAAFNVYNTLGEFMNIVFVALGGAGGIMIGHLLGAAEIEKAKNYAWRLLRLVVITGILLCPVFILLRDVMLLPFPNLSTEAKDFAREALLIMAFFIWAKSINFTNMNGILRSGGDTTGAAAIDVGMLWLFGVPLVLLAALLFHAPFWVVFSMTCAEELVKTGIGIARVRQYKWAKTLV
jgi:putative MATE family efflux protein